MSEITIERLGEEDLAECRKFLEESPDATFFHDPRWHRIIRTSAGCGISWAP